MIVIGQLLCTKRLITTSPIYWKKWMPGNRTVIRLLLCLISLAACTAPGHAQEKPADASNENIDWPSPDRKFAFRTAYGEDLHSIDLIDKASGKKLQQIDEEDSTQATWHVLWAPDSRRFALMTRLGHPIQGVDIYVRSGDIFEKLDLPDLPDADIPEKLRHGRKFPHVASQNWQEAKAWQRDGALIVTIDTMLDGAGGSIAATRTVVLRFDRADKATIAKSTIKYATGTE
jgi:hypothetical protein